MSGDDRHQCHKTIVLGPEFIKEALRNPEPAYKLKALKKGDRPYKYKFLTDNMKIHLHVKQFVADYYGLSFGGKITSFKWRLR